jgi:hypothetical protein
MKWSGVIWWLKTLAILKLKKNGHSSKYTYRCHMCFSIESPWIAKFQKPFKYQTNEQSICYFNYMRNEKEGKKKKKNHLEKCYIPNMDLSIVESEVNSPC